eukprot:3093074-Prymnesium_polylepis.1
MRIRIPFLRCRHFCVWRGRQQVTMTSAQGDILPGVTSGELASEVSARTFPHGCTTTACYNDNDRSSYNFVV